MPVFTKHLRRLSSGFTTRRKSAQSDAANDGAIPKPPAGEPRSQPAQNPPESANRMLSRTLRFQDECDTPSPAYSFVEPASPNEIQDVGRSSELASGDVDDDVATPPLTPDTPLTEFSSFESDRQRPLSIDAAVLRDSAGLSTTPESQKKQWLPDPSTFEPHILTSLPAEVWMSVIAHLDTSSAASLAMTTRGLAYRIGPPVFAAINDPSNTKPRANFLASFVKILPDHIICYACGRFHLRVDPGKEKIRPSERYARHPLTTCPRPSSTPAVRLTQDRSISFPIAHLGTAAFRHGAPHGIPHTQLNKTWKPDAAGYDGDWTHRATFTSAGPRLLVRVTSTYYASAHLTPVEQRLVLLNRVDYTANYSTCSHEASGGTILFAAAQCALDHVPAVTRATAAGGVVSQCAECRRLWRCNLCPTEYSVEVRLVEDKRRRTSGAGLPSPYNDPPGPRFRYALIISRWTDLGPCDSPLDPTWAACSSKATYADEDSEVFAHDGLGVRRAYERALGVRECTVAPVLLRRPCHWRSRRGWDLEAFVRGSDMN